MLQDSRDFCLDDAWIHLDYAKSLRLGDGLSYNPGDWETGCSSPLWVVLLAAWPLLPDPVLPVKLLGVLLHAATAWAAAGLALDLGRARAELSRPVPLLSLTLLAGTLVASTPLLLQGAQSGMEVPLAAFTVLGLSRAVVLGLPRAALVLGGAAVLARPEALGYAVALGLPLAWWRSRHGCARNQVRAPLAAAAGAFVALAAWVVYCLAVSGRPWPNAQYVKGAGGGVAGLQYVLAEVAPWQPWLVSLTGVVIIGLAIRHEIGPRRGEVWALLGAATATMIALAVTRPLHPGVQFYESRYFVPFVTLPAVVLPLGLVGLHRILALLLVLPIAVVTGLQVAEIHDATVAQEEDVRVVHSEVARHLAEALPPDARVGVEGAGAARFFTPRTMHIIDLVGLNDGRAARLHFDRTAKLCHFVEQQPTHLVLPSHWIPAFSPPFALRPLRRFVDPSYTQVLPARPHAVVVFVVEGVHPHWQDRCAD
jgi:hypothetical protein